MTDPGGDQEVIGRLVAALDGLDAAVVDRVVASVTVGDAAVVDAIVAGLAAGDPPLVEVAGEGWRPVGLSNAGVVVARGGAERVVPWSELRRAG
ncbi:hypothetical protein [Verrucosispora sp. WMMC514]|uniref:hypothetical protein n=1 Tax=Verrucosispora sp. WMMC514 TaxID=3015156 RepID=UPI00248B99F4|nr:hypothetical protein [Verrucosispora sp. WMMC514]WBB94128.1 hypothetical protein O7597_14865 [Verrucosispora sp. WMMC514]